MKNRKNRAGQNRVFGKIIVLLVPALVMVGMAMMPVLARGGSHHGRDGDRHRGHYRHYRYYRPGYHPPPGYYAPPPPSVVYAPPPPPPGITFVFPIRIR